ncbi:MAG: FHA domain-containing protein [Polyangiales bacterium]
MHTTVPEDEGAATSEWCLYIAVHPNEALVGTRRVLLRGAAIELGRDDDSFAPGALADGRISRRHARVMVDGQGALRIADLASSNGTHVNGERVEMVTLVPGDVVRIGGVLFVVQRAPVTMRAVRSALAGVSVALARMQAEVERATTTRGDVAIIEEPGSGAIRVANELFAHSGTAATEWVLSAWTDRLPASFDQAMRGAAGRGALMRGLPPKATLARSLLRECLSQPAAEGAARRVLIVESNSAADVEFAQAIAAFVVRVPPLRERPEDVPHAAAGWARERGTSVPSLSLRAWVTLLRASWPMNVAQLEATLERARLAATRGEPEDVERWISESARSDAALFAQSSVAARTAPTNEPAFCFATSGRWFVLPGGERVSLHRREVLARVLGALIRARVESPGRVVRAEQLIELAWPGERFIEGSGENRLHVALSNLRQLGLRALLTRVEDGYRIDPEVAARFVDE